MTHIDPSSPRLTRQFKTKSGDPITLGVGVGTKWKDLKRTRGGDQQHENIVQVLVDALESGYNHIDGAEAYNTHPEIAEAVRRSAIARDRLWITTKYGVGLKQFPARSKDPKEFVEKALSQLETDYIDLLLVHHPFIDPTYTNGLDLEGIWRQLEDAKDSGKVREIGVSNFRKLDLEKLFKFAKHKPVVNQIEFHPYLQNQSPEVVEFSQKNDIQVEAFGPLSPLRIVDESGNSLDHPLKATLVELSKEIGRTPAQILLRYTLQKGVLPVTTSSQKERTQQALEVYDFELDDGVIKRIDEEGASFPKRLYFLGAF